jgi:hypothetical protein
MKKETIAMVYFIIIVVLVLVIAVSLSFLKKIKQENCFSPENFDKVLDYTKWKQKTSKIGKVLVDSYKVEVNEENEIIFKEDKNNYTIFKVNRKEGIVLLAVYQKKDLTNKANGAFCELLNRALFHPVNPQ